MRVIEGEMAARFTERDGLAFLQLVGIPARFETNREYVARIWPRRDARAARKRNARIVVTPVTRQDSAAVIAALARGEAIPGGLDAATIAASVTGF